MKIAAVVILYHPEEQAQTNILSYAPFVDKLFAVDNTENPYFSMEAEGMDFIYVADQHNKGISIRLNQAAQLARLSGFDWLLTMDQDSSFDKAVFKQYLNCIESYPGKESVSMFGVNYSAMSREEGNCNSEESLQLITSGSVLNLKIWKELNGFDEQLFIDEVDFEYCLRSRKNGFKTIRFPSISMKHSLGQLVTGRSLKNAKVTSRTLHPPIRLYYIARNFFYIQKKYRQDFPKEIDDRRRSLINRIKNNVIYNPARMEVVKFLFKARGDFRKNKMGKQS